MKKVILIILTLFIVSCGSNNVEKCPIDDDSLYCTISRTSGIVGMVIYIIMILIFFGIFIYFCYYMYTSYNTSNGSKTNKK